MFLKWYDLWHKFLIGYRTVYLEQTFTLVTILQWTNTTSLILRCGTFSPFFSLVILFSVLKSNFIVSGVKSSRLYLFLILNVILFLLMVYQYFLHAFLKRIQNNLKYLIQNTTHRQFKFIIPSVYWYFKFIVIVSAFYVFHV